ncbi:MAG: VWA domain-containing protein [Ruminococcaceae bacterium]|nr:VWA domain-containing protein [Oscillospiraceae bacterium]
MKHKTLKTVLALLLATLMLLICACGGDEKAEDTSAPNVVADSKGEESKNPTDNNKDEGKLSAENKDGVIEGSPSHDMNGGAMLPTEDAMDGVLMEDERYEGDAEDKAEAPLGTPEYMPEDWVGSDIQATAGTLTAGEIRDNDDFAAWKALLESQWNSYVEEWKLQSAKRVTVDVAVHERMDDPQAEGLNLTSAGGALVKLLDGEGKVLYSAVTNAAGKAYLFYSAGGAAPVNITVNYNGKEQSVGFTREPGYSGDSYHFVFDSVKEIKKLDLMFVVDTTGSMGDEIAYLKAEVVEIINRASDTGFDVRTSVNFYRDLQDEYIVKYYAFETDPQKVKQNVAEQYASGGGDYEEAVDRALRNAVYDHAWEEDSVKILFLILDAPPHKDPQIIDDLSGTIKKAAEMGIRIIPVASSGINKDTEILLRSYAVLTGGSYAFLTDTSGVGGSHLPPSVQEYKEELLVDLMTRLIYEYCGAEYTAPEYVPPVVDDPQNTPNGEPTDLPVTDDVPAIGDDIAVGKPAVDPTEVGTKTVVNIVDENDYGFICPAYDHFYTDGTYTYYFTNLIGGEIIVYYSDGTSENVRDAFKTGIVTIEDLDRFGIYYEKELGTKVGMVDDPPKPSSGDGPKDVDYIEDLTDGGAEALEAFYVDDNYIYYFPFIQSTGIVVHYKDGTAENIVEALEYNHVSIEQLKEYDIFYYAEEKTAEDESFSVMPDSSRILSEHPGCAVKTDGFVNEDSDPITCSEDAVERAALECTVEYDTVATHYSHIDHTWAVHFSMTDTAGGDQIVYLNQSGVTLYVISGE